MPDARDTDAYFDEREQDCVLYARECVLCGECDRCDLNAQKTCDNCGACIDENRDRNEVTIDAVFPDANEMDTPPDEIDAPADWHDDETDLTSDDDAPPPLRHAIDADALQDAWSQFRMTGKWSGDDDERFPEDLA